MKKSLFKKLSSFVLAIAVASTAVLTPLSAGAAEPPSTPEPTKYTITIMPGETTVTPSSDTAPEASRFTAYQIFKGNLLDNASDNGDIHPDKLTNSEVNDIVAYILREEGATELPANCTETLKDYIGGFVDTAMEELSLQDSTELSSVEKDQIKATVYELYEADWNVRHTMSDINWGSAIPAEKVGDLLTALTALDSGSSTTFTTIKNTYVSKTTSTDTTTVTETDIAKARQAAAQEVAQALSVNDNVEFLQKFAKIVSGKAVGGTPSTWDGNAWKITPLNGGYYLVVDNLTGSGLAEGDSTAPYFLDVAQDITCMIKSTSPTIEKTITKVIDSNDTDPTTNGQQGSVSADGSTAVAGIGDIIEFELVGTLPENFGTFYDKYSYKFIDEITSGLEFLKNTVKVTYQYDNGAPITINPPAYTISGPSSNGSLTRHTITFDDLRRDVLTDQVLAQINDISTLKIKVTYQARLNAYPHIPDGETNYAQIEYTSNPNTEGDGTTTTNTTTKEKAKIYSFNVDLDKEDLSGKPLIGAKFSVTRQNENGETEYAVFYGGTDNRVVAWIDKATAKDQTLLNAKFVDLSTSLAADGNKTLQAPVPVDSFRIEAATVEVNKAAQLRVTGLDAGTYTFIETEAPNGYAKVDDFTVTLVAEKDDDGNYTGKLKVNKPAGDDPVADPADPGTTVDPAKEGDATLKDDQFDQGIAKILVIDPPKSLMPETGGIGRYIFYIGGAVLLIAGAGILFITKKKSSAKK